MSTSKREASRLEQGVSSAASAEFGFGMHTHSKGTKVWGTRDGEITRLPAEVSPAWKWEWH